MTRIILSVLAAFAASGPGGPSQWVDGSGFTYPYRPAEGVSVTEASIVYPQADPIVIDGEFDAGADGLVTIAVPGSPNDEPGIATLRLTLADGETDEVEIAVSHYREIDITGPAAESLYTPLPTDDYLVDYIPCCNIYGGLLIAERIPVNPWGTDAGLPETLLSDFMQLTPDGLTASTMGLYFEFGYASELPAERIGLYEFGRDEWREVFDYTVDGAKQRIRFHCPDGGTFVVGVKP